MYLLLCVSYSTVAPYNVSITGNNTYNYGDRLELNCLSDGGPDLGYSWSKSGANECLSNTSTLVISYLTAVDGGDYTCAVTNDAGSGNHSITIYGALATYHNFLFFSFSCAKFVQKFLAQKNFYARLNYCNSKSSHSYQSYKNIFPQNFLSQTKIK